jgi:hypothetical protein
VCLEQHQKGKQSIRTHVAILPEIPDIRCQV